MFELTANQLDSVSGGNAVLGVIAVIAFFSTAYEDSVNFTSGMIEGFMDAR